MHICFQLIVFKGTLTKLLTAKSKLEYSSFSINMQLLVENKMFGTFKCFFFLNFVLIIAVTAI